MDSVVVAHGFRALQHEESYHTKDWALSPLIGRTILNHWNTREVLRLYIFYLANHVSLTKNNNLPNSTRDQIANIRWIIEKAREEKKEKAREFQKNIYFCFIDYAKGFDCVDHNKLWKILKEMVIPDHLTCLLRNLYAGQEATVRTGHGTTDWFQKEKEYFNVVYCHSAYLIYMMSTSWETLG